MKRFKIFLGFGSNRIPGIGVGIILFYEEAGRFIWASNGSKGWSLIEFGQ